jgi:hypothetical protein
LKRLFYKSGRQWLSVALFQFSAIFCGYVYLSGIAAADMLTVTIAGSGTGAVNSNPSGIACTSSTSPCSAAFTNLSEITLSATPDWKSLNGVFNVGCSGTGSCSFNINDDTEVTATFNPNYQSAVVGMLMLEYATLTEAYANVTVDSNLAAHPYTFTEGLTLNRDIAVNFYGGMGDMYLSHVPDAFTILQGTLEIQQGSLLVDSLIIQ